MVDPITSLGRFGVWCPEDSVVKKMGRTVEDLEDMYKLPKRRRRDREDGPVGALLFDIADPFANTVMKHRHFPAAEQKARSSMEGIVKHNITGAAPQSNESFFETDEGLKFSDLRTGDDAIRYFAELESGGPVQLVYCNRVSSGKEFTPYDLDVVSRSMVDLEHFIISAAGMVHVEPGPGSPLLSPHPIQLSHPLPLALARTTAELHCEY